MVYTRAPCKSNLWAVSFFMRMRPTDLVTVGVLRQGLSDMSPAGVLG